ncbi:MAG: TonB-dependent receptor [Thauera sp.]|nr:TonB-dependent receptor [Thauera sp.]
MRIAILPSGPARGIGRLLHFRIPRPPALPGAGRLLLACALTLPLAAQAEELADLSLEQLMAVPVVGASKYEQTQDRVAAAVTVITRDEIRSFGWRTLDEALVTLPGVHTSYDRQYSYVGVRGFGLAGDYMTRVLVTIDGVRVNEPMYDGAPFGRMLPLDMDLVERIEFIPGPGGAIYGQNAMFGVVNVITRKGAALDGGEFSASWQWPQATRKARVSWGKRLDNELELMVSAAILRSDGDDLWMDFGNGDAGTVRGQDGERDQEFNLSASRGPWSFGLAHGDRRKDDPTGVFSTDAFASGTFQGDRYTVAHLGYSAALSDTLSLSTRAFVGDYRYESVLMYDGLPYDYPASAAWHGAELQLVSTALAAHTLMVGAEYQRNQRIDQNIIYPDAGYILRDRRDGYRAGVFVQDEWRITDTFASTLGLRADHNDITGTEFSPRLGLIWNASARSTLKLLYGRAHRAPNAYQMYYDEATLNEDGTIDAFQRANPGLGGEAVDTTELVLDHRASADLHLRASLYRWKIDDLINLVADENDVGQYQAIGSVESRGLELYADRTWHNGARLRGNLSFQHATGTAGERVENSPRVLGRLNFSTPLPNLPLRMGVELAYDGKRRSPAGDTVDAYWLSNLHLVAERWIPGAEVSLSVLNLFDEAYAHPSAGAPIHTMDRIGQDGRSLRLKFDYRF